jgi:hypothetical protein
MIGFDTHLIFALRDDRSLFQIRTGKHWFDLYARSSTGKLAIMSLVAALNAPKTMRCLFISKICSAACT